MYYIGEGVPKSYDKAFELIEKASESGSVMAKLFLSSMYVDGFHVEESHSIADNLLAEISDSEPGKRIAGIKKSEGWESANIEIKKLIFEPNEYISDSDLISLKIDLALGGDGSAAMWLGDYYFQGRGGEPDYSKALEWYQSANDAGMPYSRAKMNSALREIRKEIKSSEDD